MMKKILLAISLLFAGNAYAYNNGLTGSTQHSNVHNALPWAHSHTYTYSNAPPTRVNAGAGYTESSGTYTSGQPLKNYQLISRGTCTSASTGNGPTGTGSDITDGTCHWKYVSGVDYVTLTGWSNDNAPWTAKTYSASDFVRVGTKIYIMYPGVYADTTCNSTVQPSGTASSLTTSDGCVWNYITDIIYSSNASHIPTWTNARATYNLTQNYQADLWNDRVYVPGADNESLLIGPRGHAGYSDGIEAGDGYNAKCQETLSHCYRMIVAAAPGESFADKLTQYTPLTGIDSTKGVTIHGTNSGFYSSVAFNFFDSFVDLVGIQVKADFNAAYDAMTVHSNANTIQNCILEGGTSVGTTNVWAVTFDAFGSTISNSLIISHSQIGAFVSKYPAYILHNTFVQPAGQGITSTTAAIVSNGAYYFDAPTGTVVSNNAMFGFTHSVGYLNSGDGNIFAYSATAGINPASGNNATDSPATDSGAFTLSTINGTGNYVAIPPPGSGNVTSVSAASAFVNSASDYRLKSTSPLRGAGTPAGNFKTLCGTCAATTTLNVDSLNIIRRQRPQAGRWDIGAW